MRITAQVLLVLLACVQASGCNSGDEPAAPSSIEPTSNVPDEPRTTAASRNSDGTPMATGSQKTDEIETGTAAQKSYDEVKDEIRAALDRIQANQGVWDQVSTQVIVAAFAHSDWLAWRIHIRALTVVTGFPDQCPRVVREKVETLQPRSEDEAVVGIYKQKALAALQASSQ